MPWKEPGEKPREPKSREPWGRGGRGGGPDLEAWLRKMRRGLGPFGRGPVGVLSLVALLIVLWFLIGGWTVVGNQQAGMLMQFGRLDDVLHPGVHLHFPAPIDRVRIVDLGRTRTLGDEVRLLTSDGQLAMVDYDVQYRITDARRFLFSTRDAEETARNAATVAVRAVVGTHTLKQMMDRRDDALGDAVRARLAASLARDDMGVAITHVGIDRVGVPSEVKQAFDGIAKARDGAEAAQAAAAADVARQKVQTQAQAAALKASAQAGQRASVADAQAAVARFDQILAQYQAAPQVIRHRLWLQTMHDVLSKNHVVVNTGTGSVIVQFPPREGTPAPAASSAPASESTAPAPAGSNTTPVTSGPVVQGSAR